MTELKKEDTLHTDQELVVAIAGDFNLWKKVIAITINAKTEGEYFYSSALFNAATISMIDTNLRHIFPSLLNSVMEKKLQSLRDSCVDNIYKIISILHDNKDSLLPEVMSDMDTDSKEFKEICSTVIFLPNGNINILSGIQIIYIYYENCSSTKNDLNFVWKRGLLQNVSEEETRNDKSYYERLRKEYKRKIFFSNESSYIQKMKMNLSISVDGVSGNPNRELWHLLDLYGYATHDICSVSSKSQDLHYLDAMENISINGSINEIPERCKGKIFFLTILFQKMEKSERKELIESFCTLNRIVSTFGYIFGLLSSQIQDIIAADQTAGLIYAEEYQDLLEGYKKWIKSKISQVSQKNEPSEIPIAMPVITATEDRLYPLVYWRAVLSEYYSYMCSLEKMFYFSPRMNNQNGKLRLYLASQPDKKVDVGEWCEFKDKFRHQLTAFFPDVTDDELKNCWMYSTTALLFCFHENLQFPIESITPNERISEKWLKRFQDNIRSIKISHIFIMMNVYMYSSEILVETKGTNTPFFHGLLKHSTPQKSRQKNMQDLIKSIKTHYTSSVKPDNYHLLTINVFYWLMEQKDALFMAEEMVCILRELRITVWEKIKRDIICTTSIEDFHKGVRSLEKWRDNFLQEFIEKNSEAETVCPDFKAFLENTQLDIEDEPSKESKLYHDLLMNFYYSHNGC